MAVAMFMTWEGVTLAQYEEVRRITNFEGDHPRGGIFHSASHDGVNLRVFDVWESAEAFQAFTDARLMPAVQQLGLTTPPRVEIFPQHNMFTPGFNPK